MEQSGGNRDQGKEQIQVEAGEGNRASKCQKAACHILDYMTTEDSALWTEGKKKPS